MLCWEKPTSSVFYCPVTLSEDSVTTIIVKIEQSTDLFASAVDVPLSLEFLGQASLQSKWLQRGVFHFRREAYNKLCVISVTYSRTEASLWHVCEYLEPWNRYYTLIVGLLVKKSGPVAVSGSWMQEPPTPLNLWIHSHTRMHAHTHTHSYRYTCIYMHMYHTQYTETMRENRFDSTTTMIVLLQQLLWQNSLTNKTWLTTHTLQDFGQASLYL